MGYSGLCGEASNPRYRLFELAARRRKTCPHNKKALRRSRRRARFEKQSGRQDLNLRPLAPHASALASLRHAPMLATSSSLTLPRRSSMANTGAGCNRTAAPAYGNQRPRELAGIVYRPTQTRLSRVRKYSRPSAIAGVATIEAPRSFFASTSNSGPSFSTTTKPFSPAM